MKVQFLRKPFAVSFMSAFSGQAFLFMECSMWNRTKADSENQGKLSGSGWL